MADLVAAHSASTAPMIPDVMALQVPDAGDWTVLAQADRVLVRMPDGTGFAASAAMLTTLWHAAGSPRVVLLGGQLPADIPVAAMGQLATSVDPSLKGFDLRSGRFARRGASIPKGARALAVVLAIATFGHLTLLALDVDVWLTPTREIRVAIAGSVDTGAAGAPTPEWDIFLLQIAELDVEPASRIDHMHASVDRRDATQEGLLELAMN